MSSNLPRAVGTPGLRRALGDTAAERPARAVAGADREGVRRDDLGGYAPRRRRRRARRRHLGPARVVVVRDSGRRAHPRAGSSRRSAPRWPVTGRPTARPAGDRGRPRAARLLAGGAGSRSCPTTRSRLRRGGDARSCSRIPTTTVRARAGRDLRALFRAYDRRCRRSPRSATGGPVRLVTRALGVLAPVETRYARSAMVSCGDHVATGAGVAMLRAGGQRGRRRARRERRAGGDLAAALRAGRRPVRARPRPGRGRAGRAQRLRPRRLGRRPRRGCARRGRARCRRTATCAR